MLRSLFIFSFCFLVCNSFACDWSYITIQQINDLGGNYQIIYTVGIGGGILGANMGADGSTGSFFVGFGANDGSFVDIINFSGFEVSDTTICFTYPQEVNAMGTLGENGVFYVPNSCQVTCVTSTALCGLPHTQEFTMMAVTSTLPDYLQVYGLEGNGNPFAGCAFDPDNTASIIAFLPLEWGAFDYERKEDQILLEWSTLSEEMTSHFIIEKTYDGHRYFPIGEMYSNHMTTTETWYDYLVPAENIDVYYRLTMIDFDASRSTSDLLFVPSRKQTEPNLFPNPGRDQLTIDLEGEW